METVGSVRLLVISNSMRRIGNGKKIGPVVGNAFNGGNAIGLGG